MLQDTASPVGTPFTRHWVVPQVLWCLPAGDITLLGRKTTMFYLHNQNTCLDFCSNTHAECYQLTVTAGVGFAALSKVATNKCTSRIIHVKSMRLINRLDVCLPLENTPRLTTTPINQNLYQTGAPFCFYQPEPGLTFSKRILNLCPEHSEGHLTRPNLSNPVASRQELSRNVKICRRIFDMAWPL